MKRTFILLMVTALLVSALPAGSAAVAGPDFTVSACIASEPETIDPSLVSTADGSTYVQHLFENLMKYQLTDRTPSDDPNMKLTEIVPGQAREYRISADRTVYTFFLRDDILWSDGRPVTAKDWVFSWQRLVDPATASDYGYFLDGIVLNAAAIQAGEKDKSELGIRAVDDKTLEITLEAPCAYFLEICAFPPLMPLREDVVKGGWTESGSIAVNTLTPLRKDAVKVDWTEPANIVVNGPYKITEWVHDSYIRMEKNEKYYDLENLGPDAIIWWLSEYTDDIFSAYQSGEYQFIESIPSDMVASLQASGDCFINPYVGTCYLYLNCARIPDWRVRAAMALAVDREYIVGNLRGQSPATGLVGFGIPDSSGRDFTLGASGPGALYAALQRMYPLADLSTYVGRCKLARELYQAAVSDGTWDPYAIVEFVYNTSSGNSAIVNACQNDWQTVLGLSVIRIQQDWRDFSNSLDAHDFDAARMGWVADYSDPITFLELMVTGNSYNHGLYANPAFDGMIGRAKGMPVGADRDALLHEAEEALFGEGGFPVCPLYYYNSMYCCRGLTDVGYNALGYYYFMYARPAR